MRKRSSQGAADGGRAARLGPGIAALVVLPVVVLVSAATAAAQVPACTGNGIVQLAPYSCTSSRTIDGTIFTIVLRVGADRAVTVAYTLDAPRAVPTPIRVQSHVGLAGGPPPDGRASGVIPPGATVADLAVILQCGQIDIKAVTLGNGLPAGHIAAPFVTTANSCAAVPPPTSPPTTIEATSLPATTAPTTNASSAVLPAVALPPTGSSPLDRSLWIVLVLVGMGTAGIVVAARLRHGVDR
jgi:hypothetical protein